MPIDLPLPVENYLRLANARDADGVALCFAAHAQVLDEGQVHRGRDAIRAWSRATGARYSASCSAVACLRTARGWLVSADVTGNFPGSPVRLRFDFELGADSIDALAISA